MTFHFPNLAVLKQKNSGILLRLLATALFAVMALCVRLASFDAPVGQIVFWRSMVALFPIVGYMIFCNNLLGALKTRRPLGHFLRSALGCLAMFFSFLSLHYLPLSQASALGFLTPIFASIGAALFFKDKMGWFLLLVIGGSFAGVLVILWDKLVFDGGESLSWLGVVAGLLTAVISASARLQIKNLTKTEQAATIAFYFALFCAIAGAFSWFWGWVEHDWSLMPYLIGAGIAGGFAHIAATEALARAPISVLAPFEYSAVIWVLMFDLLLFGEDLSLAGLAGSAMIVAASVSFYRFRTS